MPRSLSCRILMLGLLPSLAAAADIPEISIHGFMSQGYLKSDSNNYLADTQSGSFDFNEAAVNLQTQLTPDLHAGIQLFARDLGGIGKDQVGIDWAFLDYHLSDAFGVRVGQVKIARGLYNENFDLDLANPTVLLPQQVYDERLRDMLVSTDGASVYGLVHAGPAGSFDYNLYVGTKELSNDSSVAEYLRNAVYSSQTDFVCHSLKVKRMYGGSLTWNTPLRGLRANASYYQVDDIVGTGAITGIAPVPVETQMTIERTRNLVTGLEYAKGPLTLASELALWNIDYTLLGQNGISRWGGYYAQASYRLTPKWQTAVTYGQYWQNRLDRDGHHLGDPRTGFQDDLALSLRFDPYDCWTIKAEGHYIRGWGLMFQQDNPNGFDGDTWLLALKTTVNF